MKCLDTITEAIMIEQLILYITGLLDFTQKKTNNMTQCPNCGADLPVPCSVESFAESKTIRCSTCGHVLDFNPLMPIYGEQPYR